MNCELCGQNKAIIHIQEVVSGQKKSAHFCGDCAGHKKVNLPLPKGEGLAEYIFDLSLPLGNKSKVDPPSQFFECETCNTTSEDFNETGRLGCPNCYETFKEILTELLPFMHRGSEHLGKEVKVKKVKKPSSQFDSRVRSIQGQFQELSLMKESLKEAVETENFEMAAILRDKLSHLNSLALSQGSSEKNHEI